MARGIFEAPAHAEINAVEVAEQQLVLAEASLQLQGHQQLPPFARQRLPLAHLLRIEAAGKLLGDRAAPLQHAPPQQVHRQGATRADRIHPWMPPEAAVLTGEECINQQLRIVPEVAVLAMLARFGGADRPVLAVVEHQGPAHARQIATDRHLQQCQAEGSQPKAANGCQQDTAAPQHSAEACPPARTPPVLEQQPGGLVTARCQADPVSGHQQQLLHAAAAPPESVGGSEIAQQPAAAAPLEQGMLLAHRRRTERDFSGSAAPQAVGLAHKVAALTLAERVVCPAQARAPWFSGGEHDAAAASRAPGRPPPD
jgi:hypothetical protein